MAPHILNPNLSVSFYSALSAVKPDSSETPVNMLWTVIAALCFPVTEGYKYAIGQPVLASDHQPDVVVFEVRRTGIINRGSTDCYEKQILIVECKAPHKDTPADWRSASDGQLTHYLENLVGPPGQNCYGAVAIGTKVQFYSWDPQRVPRLVPMTNQPLDLYGLAGCEEAEHILNYIRANGWEWALIGERRYR